MLNRTELVVVILAIVFACSCGRSAQGQELRSDAEKSTGPKAMKRPFITVLGIAQDAGFPQAGCRKPCCQEAWESVQLRRRVASLAITDPVSLQTWLIDCTPDFPEQLRAVEELFPNSSSQESRSSMEGVLLTHAHIGHYAGLVHLGREVMGTKAVPVWAMPRMQQFLKTNGPWNQLVKLNNIQLRELKDGKAVPLNDRISITPFEVPHRDEFSETVGFRIDGPNRSALFIPDIDKWSRWDKSIEKLIRGCDVAYLDGTFYANGEIPGRDMSQIPHPFIEESLSRFAKLSREDRSKVQFIHLNHTNPALKAESAARRQINAAGCRVARQGGRFEL